ncbi:lactoperoxidase-like [Rhincodon typus]|uniref:lactoperoxidase-like n=1 Tax=Rhincodon typus TaxID=259920 RepID=UPI002030ED55|nr:lactoperoxidase-like [Rhincodon typus]
MHNTEHSPVVQSSVCKKDCWSNRYRSINSNCNNRRAPNLGAANNPYARWLPAQYEDGFSVPKGWIEGKLYSGFPLPLAREVSNKILKTSIKDIIEDSEWTQLYMEWGQWMTHDMSLIRPSQNLEMSSNNINCERSCVQRSPCFPIKIINYRDYVPLVIGKDATEKYLRQYQGYNASVDPRLSNVFATAAMRFGHVTIQPIMKRFNEKYQEDSRYPSMLLHDTFFAPGNLIGKGGIDPIIRGLFGYPAKLQSQSSMMPDELREKLIVPPQHIALDLSAINIQRSRDHGLQGYNAWRRFCELSEPQNIVDLSLVLNNMELATNLLNLYGSPDNIDVWVGGISEPFMEGGRVGPLFACLIGQQFKNLRDGDRFWWQNKGVFTANQQQALQHISFSRLICENSKIEELPRDVFRYRPYPEGYVKCKHIPRVDLSAWKENTNVTPCGSIPVVADAHFSICKSLVRYTCNSGFKLIGKDTLKCLNNGQWNSAPPRCTEPRPVTSEGNTANTDFLKDGSGVDAWATP